MWNSSTAWIKSFFSLNSHPVTEWVSDSNSHVHTKWIRAPVELGSFFLHSIYYSIRNEFFPFSIQSSRTQKEFGILAGVGTSLSFNTTSIQFDTERIWDSSRHWLESLSFHITYFQCHTEWIWDSTACSFSPTLGCTCGIFVNAFKSKKKKKKKEKKKVGVGWGWGNHCRLQFVKSLCARIKSGREIIKMSDVGYSITSLSNGGWWWRSGADEAIPELPGTRASPPTSRYQDWPDETVL